MAPDPAEAGNILFNQISVKQANLQRLVDSWLPPQASEDVQAATSDDNLENEEQGLFTPMPETYNIAASNLCSPQADDYRIVQELGSPYQKTGKLGGKNCRRTISCGNNY